MSERLGNYRARRAILWYIMGFCTAQRFGNDLTGFSHGFNSTSFSAAKAQIGDLVIPTSTPISEWYLSWLVDIKPGENGFDTRYTLKSLETGDLRDWSNIGIKFLDRDAVDSHPEWKWTDRQFAFNDRWFEVCRDLDSYIILPTQAEFSDDYHVSLGTRTRHGFDEYSPQKTFKDWRKVTKKIMAEYYQQCVDERPSPPPTVSR